MWTTSVGLAHRSLIDGHDVCNDYDVLRVLVWTRVDMCVADRGAEKAAKKQHSGADETSHGAVKVWICLLYTSPSPRDRTRSRMPSSA